MNDNDGLTTSQNIKEGQKIADHLQTLPIVDRLCVIEEIVTHTVAQTANPQDILVHLLNAVVDKLRLPRFRPRPKLVAPANEPRLDTPAKYQWPMPRSITPNGALRFSDDGVALKFWDDGHVTVDEINDFDAVDEIDDLDAFILANPGARRARD